jgi:hypothetical protein
MLYRSSGPQLTSLALAVLHEALRRFSPAANGRMLGAARARLGVLLRLMCARVLST